MLSRHKKIINFFSVCLAISLLAAFLLPRDVGASFAGAAVSVPSYTTGSQPEEIRMGESGSGLGLNTAAVAAARMIISKLTDSIIKWVDTGFEGSPAFVTNPGSYLKDLGDQVSGIFISQLGADDLLCPRFRPQILLSLTYEQPGIEEFQCTFGQSAEEWSGFMDDFNNGGWDAFIQVSTQPQNSPYGTYLKASDELAKKKAQAQGRGRAELDWGSGFLSLKECVDSNATQDDWCQLQCEDAPASSYAACVSDCNELDVSEAQICEETGGTMENTTPGTIISSQVMTALGSDIEQMNSADTIDKTIQAAFGSILDATFGQLMKKGLAGLSSRKKPKTKPMELRPLKYSVKNSFATSIDQEEKYKEYKEKILDVYVTALMKVSALIGCRIKNYPSQEEAVYEYKGQEIKLSDLRTELQERVTQLEKDVADSEELLKVANDISNKVDGATSGEEIQKLMTDFAIQVRPFTHSSEEARKEFESEKDEIGKLINGDKESGINGVSQDLNDCLSAEQD